MRRGSWGNWELGKLGEIGNWKLGRLGWAKLLGINEISQ